MAVRAEISDGQTRVTQPDSDIAIGRYVITVIVRTAVCKRLSHELQRRCDLLCRRRGNYASYATHGEPIEPKPVAFGLEPRRWNREHRPIATLETMRRHTSLICLRAVLALGGCASTYASRIVRTGPLPVKWNKQGLLTSGPVAVTLKDVAHTPHGTVQRAAVHLWFDLQWGYLPNAVTLVHPVIVKSFGIRFLESAYLNLRTTVLSGQLVLSGVHRLGDGMLLKARLLTPSYAPQPAYFAFRRVKGRWDEVYDSFTAFGVAMAAESRRQSLAKALSPAAAAAGDAALRRYLHVAGALLRVNDIPLPPFYQP
jgi:hypothetical protein